MIQIKFTYINNSSVTVCNCYIMKIIIIKQLVERTQNPICNCPWLLQNLKEIIENFVKFINIANETLLKFRIYVKRNFTSNY